LLEAIGFTVHPRCCLVPWQSVLQSGTMAISAWLAF